MDACAQFKNVYSTCLLIFAVVLTVGLVFTEQTNLSSTMPPALAFVLLWAAVIWLTMVEGGQGSIVGLAPVNQDLYKDTHKITYECTKITNKGDNLDRYLMGRQFMVVVMVFTINMTGAPVPGAELWGFPKIVTDIMLGSGVAMILFTVMIGQLNSQVNGCHCMLDYINNYFGLFTVWVAMAIEFSGLLHSSYLVQFLVANLAGKPIVSQEEERTPMEKLFFWGRCLMSLAILCYAFAVTLGALFAGKTTMWEGVPGAISVIIFFVLMSIVGMLEGMQIAFFAMAKLTKAERGESAMAKKTCELLFRGEGRNLPGFMVGRQIFVVSCMFIVAKITSLNIAVGEGNMFGVSDSVQTFFNTGLLGALITTIAGSVVWQLVASAFPIAFLSNPVCYVFLRICLALESTGICAGAWVLAGMHAHIASFQRDEVYIGTADERAAKHLEDHPDDLHMGPGHPRKLPNFAENAPDVLKELLTSNPDVLQYLDSIRKARSGDVEAGGRVDGTEAGDSDEDLYEIDA
jgi:silicon transporter